MYYSFPLTAHIPEKNFSFPNTRLERIVGAQKEGDQTHPHYYDVSIV